MTASTEASTWDDEKREVWQSVIEAMREPDLDTTALRPVATF